MKTATVLYRPLSLGASLAGGLIASALFKQVWKRVAGEDEAPDATDRSYSFGEVVIAAALQGAIFATVKAIIHRGGAEGYRKLTGSWPDQGGRRSGR